MGQKNSHRKTAVIMMPMMFNLLTTKSKDKLLIVNDTFSSVLVHRQLQLRLVLIQNNSLLITTIILATKLIAANSYFYEISCSLKQIIKCYYRRPNSISMTLSGGVTKDIYRKAIKFPRINLALIALHRVSAAVRCLLFLSFNAESKL